MEQQRVFVCMWTFIGWQDISLGFHVCLGEWYIDLHVPFGWLRVGWEKVPRKMVVAFAHPWYRQYGLIKSRFYRRMLNERYEK
jgi:hypothetical protein